MRISDEKDFGHPPSFLCHRILYIYWSTGMDLDTCHEWKVDRIALREADAHTSPGRHATPHGYAPDIGCHFRQFQATLFFFLFCDQIVLLTQQVKSVQSLPSLKQGVEASEEKQWQRPSPKSSASSQPMRSLDLLHTKALDQ